MSTQPPPASSRQHTSPRSVFLHVGLHKTGTTYVQELLAANRSALRAVGVDFPGGPGEPSQAFAVWDLHGRRAHGTNDTRVAGQWDELVAHVTASGLPTTVISDEHLALSTVKQARAAVAAFDGIEVHVVITARDLARVAVSAWQQQVKSDQTWTWRQFADAISDQENITRNPARSFWLAQDVVRIAETWDAVVGVSNVHVVTVPPAGAPMGLLMERFADVVGFDPAVLVDEPSWANESVGVAGTEVIRRLNERLEGRLNQREYHRVVRQTVARTLAERPEAGRFGLPPEELPWVREQADRLVSGLVERGYPVVGDLEDLRPRMQDGLRLPDDADDDELLDATVDALAGLAERYATSWWVNKRASVESIEDRGGLGSRARGALFKTQRKAVEFADRNQVAEKALGIVLRARDRATRRSQQRSERD